MTDNVSLPAEPDRRVDNRGGSCASGIADVQRALADLGDGDVLVVESSDRRATDEYPQLAEQTGHELLGIESERTGLVGREYTVYLRVNDE